MTVESYLCFESTRSSMVQTASEEPLRIPIRLPRSHLSLRSHEENIDYAIEQIESYTGGEAVIAHRLVKGLGVRETRHEVMPLELAEELDASYERFRYTTLGILLQSKADIEAGKYKVTNGSIIGFSDSYRKAKGYTS